VTDDIRVVHGSPTDEELAALVVVLTVVGSTSDRSTQRTAGSRWSAPATRLRTAYGPSRGGWRASGLPR
jgi:hypothetical protein